MRPVLGRRRFLGIAGGTATFVGAPFVLRAQTETLVVQLKINKEFGFLKSDIWDNPDRIHREFFHRA